MAKTYELIRVTTSTFLALLEHQGRLMVANELGANHPFAALTGKPTLDYVILDLLTYPVDHRERARKSSMRKKGVTA